MWTSTRKASPKPTGKTVGKPVETVPQIFLDQKHIGGCTDFEAYAKEHLGLFAEQ